MFQLLMIMLSWFSPTGATTACVSYWQRELGLDDWAVVTKISREEDLGRWTLGDIDIDEGSKTVILRLMRVEDSDLSPRLAQAEQRFTIAHELMHLRLYVNKDPNWRNEKVVDTAAISLMRRKGRWNELLAVEGE